MRKLAWSAIALVAFGASSAVALGALASGCAKKGSSGFDDATPADLADGGGSFGDKEGGTVAKLPECAEDTKDPYVIASDQTLYEFHPATLEFQNRGRLDCPAGGATPTSMAVDRTGIAWVRYSDGTIWQVSTKDLSCALTKFEVPTDGTFQKFGMGFSTFTSGSTNEYLFLSDHDGAGLAKLDTSTLKITFVGAYTGDLAGRTSELTGTGDGKLYGFFVTSPAQIAEISKGTGEILSSKPLPGVDAGDAWAFSFYGGDFYIYTASTGGGQFPQANGGSDVTRYSPAKDAIEVVKQKIGFTIVGAGVSTCAPTSGPR